MTKTSSMPLAALAFLISAGVACAQPVSTTTTTTTWSPDQGEQLTRTWTTNKYVGVTEPTIRPTIGAELPSTVTFYPLPETIRVPNRERYGYSVINRHPVVVEKSTRRVVHTWD